MKAFVVFASCLAITSAGGRGNFGGPSFGGNSGGNGSGGYSNSNPGSGSSQGGSSGSSGYSNPGASSGGSGGNGGYSSSSNGSGGGFGNTGLTMSSLMSLLGGAGGFGQSGGYGGGNGVEGQRSSDSNGRGYDNGVGAGSAGANMGQQNSQGGQVRRFVSVHVAPEETAPREARVIRAGGAPDTHVNIIFVKAPSGANEQQTEVVLPEPPKQKTLVYVLIKKAAEGEDNVKIRAPPPTKPSKPEVYFIRYKPDGDAAGVGGSNGGASATGAGSTGPGIGFGGFAPGMSSGTSGNALSSAYGAPSQQQNEGGSNGGGYQ